MQKMRVKIRNKTKNETKQLGNRAALTKKIMAFVGIWQIDMNLTETCEKPAQQRDDVVSFSV